MARPTTISRIDIFKALTQVESLMSADTAKLIRSYIMSLEASCDHMMGLLERANTQIAALEAKLRACELGSDDDV
jgi:hypothetical protein